MTKAVRARQRPAYPTFATTTAAIQSSSAGSPSAWDSDRRGAADDRSSARFSIESACSSVPRGISRSAVGGFGSFRGRFGLSLMIVSVDGNDCMAGRRCAMKQWKTDPVHDIFRFNSPRCGRDQRAGTFAALPVSNDVQYSKSPGGVDVYTAPFCVRDARPRARCVWRVEIAVSAGPAASHVRSSRESGILRHDHIRHSKRAARAPR